MSNRVVRVLMVSIVAGVPLALCILGQRGLTTDELPGEVGYTPPAPVTTPWSGAANSLPGPLHKPDEVALQRWIAKLHGLGGVTYPCTAHLDVRVRKLSEPESASSSRIAFRLDASSAEHWSIRSDEKQHGSVSIVREGAEMRAALPWEFADYRCVLAGPEARCPLFLPDSLIDPRFLVGIDDAETTAQFAATSPSGRLRSAYFTVDLGTGVVRRIEAHIQNGPSVDRRHDFVLVQEIKSVGKLESEPAHLDESRPSELLSDLPAQTWEPIPIGGH